MACPTYDISFEDLLANQCTLDKNPILCVSPLEESSYQNVKLYSSSECFKLQLDSTRKSFMLYLNSFIKDCIDNKCIQKYLVPNLARMLVRFKNIKTELTTSLLIIEWKTQANSFAIFNPKNDFNIIKEQDYTRQAYLYFYKASQIQLKFVRKILADIKLLLKVNRSIAGSSETQGAIEPIIITAKPEIIKECRFRIRQEAKKKSHDVLAHIHKALKEEKYIECTLPEFKQVFTSNEPKPIVWLKSRRHLTYLIKQLTVKFIEKTTQPSCYEVANKCFFNGAEGKFFESKKLRHDKDPREEDVKFINDILQNSVGYFLMYE